MADSVLTKDQALVLLKRLATDDAYRDLYSQKPAKALAEIGVPLTTIVDLDAKCLCSIVLADKSVMEAEYQRLRVAAADYTLSMQPPNPKLD